ncbi:MAG: Na+-translocating NADH-quinone reductase subunit C [Bacteroidales bacterium]|nr:Na+-translocating NADH-quinone reductase subunit C [Bacteroidales bacterium]
MNTNSNSYTIIYASVMVIIVAFLLAFVSSSLKERQDKNVELDKMKQILTSLNITDVEDAEKTYNQYIKSDLIIDLNGNTISEKGGFDLEAGDDRLAVFVCDVNGATKYILPLYGKGMWDAIGGYLCLNDDKQTIYGAFFSHKGETPGLGAEIATTNFQGRFPGKRAMSNGEVKLKVVKNGKVQDASCEVDGISGGTVTSGCVSNMLQDYLTKYKSFLTK